MGIEGRLLIVTENLSHKVIIVVTKKTHLPEYSIYDTYTTPDYFILYLILVQPKRTINLQFVICF